MSGSTVGGVMVMWMGHLGCHTKNVRLATDMIRLMNCSGHIVVSGMGQKSNPLATLQYGQLMNNTGAGSMQPSQLFVPYDPGQPVSVNQPTVTPASAAAPTINNSQIIGSQLLHHRWVTAAFLVQVTNKLSN